MFSRKLVLLSLLCRLFNLPRIKLRDTAEERNLTATRFFYGGPSFLKVLYPDDEHLKCKINSSILLTRHKSGFWQNLSNFLGNFKALWIPSADIFGKALPVCVGHSLRDPIVMNGVQNGPKLSSADTRLWLKPVIRHLLKSFLTLFDLRDCYLYLKLRQFSDFELYLLGKFYQRFFASDDILEEAHGTVLHGWNE